MAKMVLRKKKRDSFEVLTFFSVCGFTSAECAFCEIAEFSAEDFNWLIGRRLKDEEAEGAFQVCVFKIYLGAGEKSGIKQP
jgi:hypothetical protein